jgi:putative addiction module component (TIGR02574 family)
MIAERIPQLSTLTKDEKWQLMVELEEELMADDPTMQEPLASEIVAELERRHQHYLEHPETAVPWEEVSRRMRALRSQKPQP